MRSRLAIPILLYFCWSPAFLYAHPHMFARLHANVIYDGSGIIETEVEWEMDELNSEMFLSECDKNKNFMIEEDEIPLARKFYVDQFEKNNFYLTLYLDNNPNPLKNFKITFKKVYIKERAARFLLSVDYPLPFRWKDQILAFFFNENGTFISFQCNQYRTFLLTKKGEEETPPISVEYPLEYPSTIFVHIGKIMDKGTNLVELSSKEIEKAFTSFKSTSGNTSNLKARFYAFQGTYNQKVSQLILRAKEKWTAGTVLLIFFFAFLYGLIHTAGPGHGKTFVVSFFLQHDVQWVQAFPFAALIALIHTGSAILLSALFLSYLTSFNGMERIILQTRISFGIAVFIVALGIWLLIRLLFFHRHSHGHTHHDGEHNHHHSHDHDEHNHDHGDMDEETHAAWHAAHDHNHADSSSHAHDHMPPNCHEPESPGEMKKNMFRMAFAAGSIPCPLSITIMLVAVTQNIFLLGVITVLGIAAGIITVLSTVGILVIKTKDSILAYSDHHSHSLSHWIHISMDYIGAVLIILLGIGLSLLYMPSF